MVRLLAVDSGTTNTRLRLVEDGRVIQSFQAQAGARDGPKAIASALSALLHEARGSRAQAVMFSGMITSPTGLIEIPHVPGPLPLDRLRPLRHDFPNLSKLPFYFIPGVRMGEPGSSPASGDIIRGEETELAGYLSLHGVSGRRLFVHLGSHHKALQVTDGVLTGSSTAMTGELFMAAAEHTLLSSSLQLTDAYDLDWAMEGAKAAEKEGLPRALFALRLMDIREKLPMGARMGWALGAFAQQDIMMLTPWLQTLSDQVVLYGRESFAQILAFLLAQRWPSLDLTVLTQSESDALAPAGAWLAYQNREEMDHDR